MTGLGGTVSNLTVTLQSLSHTWKCDVDILLVSPGGQKVLLMSDAGSSYTASGSVTLTLLDAAAASLPASSAIISATFRPTDYASADTFSSPAPAGPYAATLAAFNGQTAN